jgi:hypothetical protein
LIALGDRRRQVFAGSRRFRVPRRLFRLALAAGGNRQPVILRGSRRFRRVSRGFRGRGFFRLVPRKTGRGILLRRAAIKKPLGKLGLFQGIAYRIPVYHKKTNDHNKKKRPKNKADRTFAGFPLGFLFHRHNFMICGLTWAVNRRDGFPAGKF